MIGQKFLNIVLIASGALWCAAGATAVLVHPTQNNAPAARAESPAEPFDVRWIELPLAKADRIVPSPPPAPTVAQVVAPSAPAGVREEKPATEPRKVDRVCGARGRRYFRRHHHMTWRCRGEHGRHGR